MRYLFLLGILFIYSAGFGKILTYQYTTGKKVVTNSVNPQIETDESTGEIKVVFADEGRISEFVADKNWFVKLWTVKNAKNNTDFTGVRNGNILKIDGISQGKEVHSENKLDDKPWYQLFENAISDFAKSGKSSIEFWLVRQDNLEPFKMVLKRVTEETITVNGQKVEAIKIRHTLPGAMAAFWGSDYWVRKSDFNYIKFKGLQGPPGSPETIGELISEE